VRRVLLAAALVCLVPAAVSYIQAITQSSNSSLGVRTVEWLRDNGARGLVNTVENIYYSWTAPAKGGPALRSLPQVGVGVAGAPSATTTGRARRRVVHHYRPARIRPLIGPALPGEGVWHAANTGVGTRAPVLVTTFRSDPVDYPQMIAGVAWIDHTRTRISLYPGLVEPSVTISRGLAEVPSDTRSRLVATFNSGFKLSDSGGGFAVDGHTYAAMQPGIATLVGYTSGRVDVTAWSGGSDVPAGVAFARQNLPLIVNHGRPNPNLSDGPEWGATLGNAIRVWRSGIGIDRHHNLIYAAADNQTVASLAAILIHAGAVRAMELDINSYWVSFITYRRRDASGASNLLPDMVRTPLRYLSPDDRDFFAIYLR
jgi:hypothetical protein